ncbi:MAG: hypothetical protein WBP03_02100 [Candidatus Saccharimonadales bacterium]
MENLHAAPNKEKIAALRDITTEYVPGVDDHGEHYTHAQLIDAAAELGPVLVPASRDQLTHARQAIEAVIVEGTGEAEKSTYRSLDGTIIPEETYLKAKANTDEQRWVLSAADEGVAISSANAVAETGLTAEAKNELSMFRTHLSEGELEPAQSFMLFRQRWRAAKNLSDELRAAGVEAPTTHSASAEHPLVGTVVLHGEATGSSIQDGGEHGTEETLRPEPIVHKMEYLPPNESAPQDGIPNARPSSEDERETPKDSPALTAEDIARATAKGILKAYKKIKAAKAAADEEARQAQEAAVRQAQQDRDDLQTPRPDTSFPHTYLPRTLGEMTDEDRDQRLFDAGFAKWQKRHAEALKADPDADPDPRDDPRPVGEDFDGRYGGTVSRPTQYTHTASADLGRAQEAHAAVAPEPEPAQHQSVLRKMRGWYNGRSEYDAALRQEADDLLRAQRHTSINPDDPNAPMVKHSAFDTFFRQFKKVPHHPHNYQRPGSGKH